MERADSAKDTDIHAARKGQIDDAIGDELWKMTNTLQTVELIKVCVESDFRLREIDGSEISSWSRMPISMNLVFDEFKSRRIDATNY